jgi:hypothetical protein
VLFLLCGYSAVYALLATAGRACLGPHAALAPRYTIYAVPGLLGLYLAANRLAPARRRLAVTALVALLLVKEARSGGDRESARSLSAGRSRWAACYRDLHDVERCDRQAEFEIYPAARRGITGLETKLRYLEANSLSLFAAPEQRQ